jgi:hypothetical protein
MDLTFPNPGHERHRGGACAVIALYGLSLIISK